MANNSELEIQQLRTPCIVYDLSVIRQQLDLLQQAKLQSDFTILYSIKSASYGPLLQSIAAYVDGFSTSSWYETKFIREQISADKLIYYSSPSLNQTEFSRIQQYADFISFNSYQQAERMSNDQLFQLRINPQTAFGLDERYDPCRLHSKLGVSLSTLAQLFSEQNPLMNRINGLHIHNNCGSSNFNELYQTVDTIVQTLGRDFQQINTLNLGGGYLFHQKEQLHGLVKTVEFLNTHFDLQLFFEPGRAIVDAAGSLITTVIDKFVSDDKDILVLDTSVNHLPEIFEYQRRVEVERSQPDAKYGYRLAGCSCLSGDLFGDYRFQHPVNIGDRLTMKNIGAYMLVKANMFNGIDLPDIYVYDNQRYRLIKSHGYEDYLARLT